MTILWTLSQRCYNSPPCVEPCIVGCVHRFSPIGDLEQYEDAGGAGAHGCLRQREPVRDCRVRCSFGNFWVDLTRTTLYILLPLSIVLALIQVSQGGLYGMLVFAIIAVFVAGLMVGRTPEYLGKKIEAYEMKMASLVILIPPIVVLGFTAVAVVTPAGKGALFNPNIGYTSIYNPGAHGFSEALYAFSSMGNNNRSAFAGLARTTRSIT
jgi:K+-transporting ATPase A subunit